MEEPRWYYEKMNEEGKVEVIGSNRNDFDGKITGKIVFGVKEYFDENPDERIARGWIKHIEHDTKSIAYNHQTQYLVKLVRTIDANTVEDEFRVMERSEEMMRLAELDLGDWYGENGIVFMGG